MTTETEGQRTKRERQRVLFDGVAELYDATRQSYPAEIVDTMFTTSPVGPGARVLEIGCGTGQLTRQLAGRGPDVTAIDIGPAMVRAARRNMSDPAVRFQVAAFEDFTESGPYELIVSATAFHWIDPGFGLTKTARLLRPGGWLALLTTGERYPEALRTELRQLWATYSRRREGWSEQPAWAAALRETTLFGEMVEARHEQPVRLPAEMVIGVESTRATFLSYSPSDQAAFTARLRKLLESAPHVDLVQQTYLAMAQVAG
jgi:SAM-dependent methyltransferase